MKGMDMASETTAVATQRRWIVGFDGSESSKSAAWWAVANAPGRVESISLVTVWNVASTTVYSAFAPIMVAEGLESAEREARHLMESFVSEIAPRSTVPIVGEFVHGDPVTRLLDGARTSEQLVLGARGGGRFERLLLGSTSHRCATHSTVPTAIVRQVFEQPPPPVGRLVVGFDGSDNALAAVDWACTFASPGSAIDIVAAWEFTPSLFSGEPFSYPEAAARAREHFDEQVTGMPPAAKRDDIDVTTSFVLGRPRDQLAARSSDADLLVIGARGRGAIGSALLGSVSTWLLHHVERPMVVVPG